MDEQKKERIEKLLRKQRYILKATEANILKLEAQLDTGETRTSRNKPKVTKSDMKVTKSDVKVAPELQKTQEGTQVKTSFYDDFVN